MRLACGIFCLNFQVVPFIMFQPGAVEFIIEYKTLNLRYFKGFYLPFLAKIEEFYKRLKTRPVCCKVDDEMTDSTEPVQRFNLLNAITSASQNRFKIDLF